jgi:hypothetical protein
MEDRMTFTQTVERMKVLEDEIQILKNRLLDGPTLKVLGKRIEELEELIETRKGNEDDF